MVERALHFLKMNHQKKINTGGRVHFATFSNGAWNADKSILYGWLQTVPLV
jgi:hypothetical protein